MPRPGLAPQKSKYTKKARCRGNEVCELIYCEKTLSRKVAATEAVILKIAFGECANCRKRTFRTLIPLSVKIVEALWRAFETVDAQRIFRAYYNYLPRPFELFDMRQFLVVPRIFSRKSLAQFRKFWIDKGRNAGKFFIFSVPKIPRQYNHPLGIAVIFCALNRKRI